MGWMSAHVYLGMGLLFIGTLHTGFQLDWNVHTLAYVLMVVVIVSGFYGLYVYMRYPRLITLNRRDRTREQMFAQLDKLDQALLHGAADLNEVAHKIMLSVVNETTLGGSIRQQLAETNHTKMAQHSIQKINDLQMKLMSVCQDKNIKKISELLKIVSRRHAVLEQLSIDIHYSAVLEYWLYFHIPISFALFAALFAHIVTVFFYW
jgi:hypothetical protein